MTPQYYNLTEEDEDFTPIPSYIESTCHMFKPFGIVCDQDEDSWAMNAILEPTIRNFEVQTIQLTLQTFGWSKGDDFEFIC